MTKNYLLLLTLCIFSSVNSQIINIPDASFKAKLLGADVDNSISMNGDGTAQKIDKNGDGEIQESEALLISSLDIRNSNISSLEGIQGFKNLLFLECSDNKITTLDLRSLSNLKIISCDRNNMITLNVQNLPKLQEISCWTNKMTELNLNGLSGLKNLQCGENMITSLDLNQCPDLINLGIYKNKISNLDLSSFSKLENLFCGYNELVNLDLSSSINMKTLHCDNNKLTNLKLPVTDKLWQLGYAHNFLTNIDLSQLSGLLELMCGSNKIKKLDLKGLEKLQYLDCYNNEISNLGLSEVPNLTFLNCFGNLLTQIDATECKDLQNFYCNDNPLLQNIFLKNGSIEIDLDFSNNPKLEYVCVDDEQINSVQNILIQEGYKDYNVNSYCSFAPGGESFSIQGTNRNDLDNNGCDALDIPTSFLKFKIDDGLKFGSFISNDAGKYDIKVTSGNFNIVPVFENPSYFSISPPSVQVEFPTVSGPFVQDFCVKAIGIHNDLEVTIISIWPARPGFAAKYKIIYKNKGTSTLSGIVNFAFDDAVLDLTSSNPPISAIDLNKRIWNFANLKPFESREIVLTFHVNSPTETPAVSNGDILSYSAVITSSETDELPLDNVFAFNQAVVGSYDPNDKTCLEGNVITPTLIGEYVHYIIRFENTGTYLAKNIVVNDIVDLSKFDISTLVPISASHSYVTKISDGNKVEFIFENINLPFNSVNRNGYIAFKIKTLPTLKVGDSFANEANIYFDYNFPILTNKATSTFKTLGVHDFEFSHYFNLFPNPVNDVLNITIKNEVEMKSLAVYDISGQLVIAVPHAENVSKIDVSKLPTGNYILKITTDKGLSVEKFIIR
jgi:Leucine-rich repeat (LRR) protein